MPTPAQFLSQAFNGLGVWQPLALISSGLTIILGTLGVLNFAHGAMFTVGAYTAYADRAIPARSRQHCSAAYSGSSSLACWSSAF